MESTARHAGSKLEEARTPDGEALTSLILAIFRANGRISRVGDAMSRDLDLTSGRWQVLGAVAETPLTVAQIARRYELTRQGILWVVQAMIRVGLVELIPNPDHRRAKLVRPTASGAAIYKEISMRQRRWVSELATRFDIAELEQATRLLAKLSEQLGPQDGPEKG